ncbi:MAG TPA: DUF72 domain-containing protein [Polyangiaceae bacterium]|jgi:uncharacterized protein YecE (DUF72 family)|nr:DUF72 domain-containing protein [Polyangiaceae bacterium]
MPSLSLHFGLPRLKGRLGEYKKAFDFVEVLCDPAPPTLKHLGRLRREAPEGFHFGLVAGRALSELGSTTPDAALIEATRRAAQALEARWLLLRTPASAGPSARTRTKLARLVEALGGAASALAWEPRGMWTDEELMAVTEELGLTLVRDLAEQDAPPAPIVYTRLLALGRNSRLGSGAIERVTDRLDEAKEAFIVIEGDGAVGVAKRLRASLGQARADDDALDDDALDEADDDEIHETESDGTDDDADDADSDDSDESDDSDDDEA